MEVLFRSAAEKICEAERNSFFLLFSYVRVTKFIQNSEQIGPTPILPPKPWQAASPITGWPIRPRDLRDATTLFINHPNLSCFDGKIGEGLDLVVSKSALRLISRTRSEQLENYNFPVALVVNVLSPRSLTVNNTPTATPLPKDQRWMYQT